MEPFWIGTVGNSLFLFDREIQPEDTAAVTLFSYSYDMPVKLDKAVVKRYITTCKDEAGIEDILKRYNEWKKFYRSELKAINAGAILETKKFLDSVQKGSVQAHWGRKAHCHSCGNSLTGKRGNICPDCFWITCNCGACGCDWNPHRSDRR
jgi:hypothetical protein